MQLVLSIGEQLEPQQIGPVPTNAIIVKRAPQLELLKLASVCITHSGLNTVLESLAQGVPQVAIPVTFDQPGIAARVGHHKTGVVTSLDKLTASRGRGIAHRSKTTAGILPLRFAHPAKIHSSATTPVTDLVH